MGYNTTILYLSEANNFPCNIRKERSLPGGNLLVIFHVSYNLCPLKLFIVRKLQLHKKSGLKSQELNLCTNTSLLIHTLDSSSYVTRGYIKLRYICNSFIIAEVTGKPQPQNHCTHRIIQSTCSQ